MTSPSFPLHSVYVVTHSGSQADFVGKQFSKDEVAEKVLEQYDEVRTRPTLLDSSSRAVKSTSHPLVPYPRGGTMIISHPLRQSSILSRRPYLSQRAERRVLLRFLTRRRTHFIFSRFLRFEERRCAILSYSRQYSTVVYLGGVGKKKIGRGRKVVSR